jgi:hypothetical protein
MPDDNELEKLRKEVNELRQRIDPPPKPASTWQPHDYTANFTMPRSAMQAMLDAVPDSLMRDLRGDARRPNPITGSAPPSPQPSVQRGSGWQDATPLKPPEGIKWVDQIAEGFDKRERRGG